MPRSIELVVEDGETLESALRRFKSKAQQEDIVKEVKRHAFYLKPGEKRSVKEALARKRRRKNPRALLDHAIQEVRALPPERQEAIAEAIFAELRAGENPETGRFQQLVEAKYTRGLTPSESSEMDLLEGSFRRSDEAFYGPIIEMAKARKSTREKLAKPVK